MNGRDNLLIGLPDYERIFRTIYTVLDGRANTHRACIFFAITGAAILRDHHGLDARPVSGAAAFLVDDAIGNVATFAEIQDGKFLSSSDRFHCWVECDGWILDFMAPLLQENMRDAGFAWTIPRKMFQRRANESGTTPGDFERGARFVLHESPERTIAMHESFKAKAASRDLCGICTYWYRRVPKRMESQLDMGDDAGGITRLQLHGPTVDGTW